MTLDTSKNTGDTITAIEWNEAATAANKVTDQTLTASDISDFDTEVSNNTDVAANTTHRSSDGSDHTFIDQDVTTTGTPQFTSLNLTSDSQLSYNLTGGAYPTIFTQAQTGSTNPTFFGTLPEGASNESGFFISNDSDVDNNGALILFINGTDVEAYPSTLGTGSTPTNFYFGSDAATASDWTAVAPWTDSATELGTNAKRWSTVFSDEMDAPLVDYDYATATVSSLGNLGTTETIDWSTASYFDGTLDDDVTITHSNESEGEKVTLTLAYDGTAQRTITWSDVDKWEGGSAPSSPSASGEVLVVMLVKVGTTVYGSGGIYS